MPTRNADEEFEFLLNFLASDGVDPDPEPPRGAAAGSRKGDDGDRSLRVQRGSDGKLDLGQVKAFYESKNTRGGKGVRKEMGRGVTGSPGFTDHSRNHSGLSIVPHARTLSSPCIACLPLDSIRCHVVCKIFGY